MKDFLAQLIKEAPNFSQARNVVREYLQARILESLQRAGAMIPLAFHGGTALRFLFRIPRYSEDLDFALEYPGKSYDFGSFLRKIRADLRGEGYSVELKASEKRVVHSAFVRFRGLPYELELSPHPEEVFSVKIEVDTKPPAGATLVTTVVRNYVILQMQHHDRASLFSGKLRSILTRPYTKGRDVYDLFWYLSDPGWPPPNFAHLNNALEQTGWSGERLTESNWRKVLQERLTALNWDKVLTDARPFLEVGAESAFLTRDSLLQLVVKPW